MEKTQLNKDQKIHWSAQPKQEIALSRNEDEILFGGARGGGKTDAGQAFLLYDIGNPRYKALVIRRNATDLDDWIDRAKIMYAAAGAKYTGNSFTFPSGAKIRTGHLKDDNAYSKYQGHEYHKILIEELTHIPNESDYEKLRASCRSTVPGIKPQMFATTNPDGPGRKWVKRRWNIPDVPSGNVKITDEKSGMTRIFIPSKLEDNKILMENDPLYIKQLESITDEELKAAWLEGSWTGFGIKGAYYKNQINQAYKENRITNVPHDEFLPVHTWWDLGIGDATTIGFFQVVNKEWRIIDYYEGSGEGMAYYVSILAQKGYIYGKHYAPHDIMAREMGTGVTRYETAKKLGLTFQTRFVNDKELSAVPMLSIDDGINAVRGRFNTLWIDKTKCDRLIECLTNYQKEWNDKMGEFKSSPLHDQYSHGADMMRYWSVTNIVEDNSVKEIMARRILQNRMARGTMK